MPLTNLGSVVSLPGQWLDGLSRNQVIHPDKIQLIFFFLISYLLSRVFVRFELPKSIVRWLIVEKHITISRLSWLIITGTALISMLIANVVTLMAMIPVLELIQNQFDGSEKERRKFSTLMMLSAVWGANIGGMGMLTGTTTNGILVGVFEAKKFPISAQFTFLSWMSWAIPLALLLCVIGWLVLMLVFRPSKQMQGGELRSQLGDCADHKRGQRISIWLAAIFLLSATVLSSSMSFFPKFHKPLICLSLMWMLCFLYIFFIQRFKLSQSGEKGILLPRQYIFHDLPKKGLLWVLLGAVIAVLMVGLRFDKRLALLVEKLLTGNSSPLILLLFMGVITIFATELMSNTLIQFAMFLTLFKITSIGPEISWQAMLLVSLCSTCAFMSPVATPSNGLGFGSIKKISLGYMLLAGFVMNIYTLLTITFWVYYVVPWVLGFFA